MVHVGEKALAIEGAIQQAGRRQPVHPQRGDERAGLPVLMGRVVVDARAPEAAAIPAQEISGNAAFVQKDQTFWVQRGQRAAPLGPRRGHGRPILLGRAHRFF